MRLIQVVQVVLVIMIALLASSDTVITANKRQVTVSSVTSVAESIRRFSSVEGENKRESTDPFSIDEERANSVAVTGAAEGGRAGAGGTVVSTAAGAGGTVTVTKYWNNGFVQRFERWLKKLFRHKTSSSTRRFR